jgi:hypothetical protein
LSDERLAKLNSIYTDADAADKSLFSEMRSNCLLYSGNHYSHTKEAALRDFVRGSKAPQEKKLRLTKNHIGLISDRLIATITGHSPSVLIQGKHKMEVQDKLAAQIASGVWDRIKNANHLDDQIADFAFDFVVIGEMAAFVHFDPKKGEYLGDAQVMDELGNVYGTQPKFSGEVITKRLEPFNLLRDPQAKSWETSPYVIYREMSPVEEIRELVKDDPEKVEKIQKSADDTFVVFDHQKGQYSTSSKDKVLIKHLFYRPCHEYPQGHYILYTSDVVIAEGSLYGVFPIVRRAYSKVTTSPRGHSVIKRLRPCQAEVNRIASTISSSQVFFRDRLMIQNGSKISNGGTMAGAVVMRYSGAAPQVQQGQSGDKYLPMLSQQIEEMYRLANVDMEEDEKVSNADPMSLLFRSLKDKKRFSQKSDIFESFLKELAMVSIDVARIYYTDEHIIPAVDKKDFINIQEFKNISSLNYSIEVKANSADIESTLGQSLSINHAIQYGQNLPPEQLSALIASMPYLKDSHLTQEITADYRAVEDVFAAIERGEEIAVLPSDNHDYFIKKISNRMKESSFRYLDPFIQNLYQSRLSTHEQIKADQADRLLRAQQGMIPASGALIPVSIYLDPDNASKRVRLPHDAVVWLYKKLDEQGALQAQMQEFNPEAIADIADMMPIDSMQAAPNEGTAMSMPQPGLGDMNGY